MVPYLSPLIDGSILRNHTTPIDYFLNSGVLSLECLPAHIIWFLVEYKRDITKSYKPS